MSRKAGKIWREYGALEYRECLGDDFVAKGALPFPRLARLKPGETLFFSWIVYRSRVHRNRVMAKIMKDPRLAGMTVESMPFDVKRMSFGGFRVRVDL
jgi:uncharacterized protein YbaA (DUF1428 family)